MRGFIDVRDRGCDAAIGGAPHDEQLLRPVRCEAITAHSQHELAARRGDGVDARAGGAGGDGLDRSDRTDLLLGQQMRDRGVLGAEGWHACCVAPPRTNRSDYASSNPSRRAMITFMISFVPA